MDFDHLLVRGKVIKFDSSTAIHTYQCPFPPPPPHHHHRQLVTITLDSQELVSVARQEKEVVQPENLGQNHCQNPQTGLLHHFLQPCRGPQ